jgi:lycopene beta-cyclase
MKGSVHYDHAIVGAGISGLILARKLLSDHPPAGSAPPSVRRVLVVDPCLDRGGRFTVAFWSTGATPLDAWMLGRWQQLRVVGHDDRITYVALDGYHYTAVSWDAARADLLAELRLDPRVTIIEAPVDAVRDGSWCAWILVGGEWISASWVYDSRPRPPEAHSSPPASRRTPELYQTFRGVWVRSHEPRVATGAATLLDFSADDGPDLGFAYVLPVDEHTALVMAVRMGASLELPDPFPAVPRELGDDGWQVVADEIGATTLRVPPPPRREGRRILAIGGRGGRVRPSTGYAVTRILADTEAIAVSLDRRGHPFAIPADPLRDRVLDVIWLHALARQRAALEPAFLALFSGVPIDSVLRFLDGGAGVRDLARVVAALPPGPFVKSATELVIQRAQHVGHQARDVGA